jgi:hypothetical protein
MTRQAMMTILNLPPLNARSGRPVRKTDPRAGFAIGPILYLLAMAGVGAAVLFSGYSQILRSNVEITADTATRNQIMNASEIVASRSELNNSIPQQFITPTPVSLAGDAVEQDRLPFVDSSKKARITAQDLANGTATEPSGIGVMDPSWGGKQLDSWGRYILMCGWSPESNPQSNLAYVLLSAGPDGVLQTRCGDTTVKGDDRVERRTVAEAISRASVWRPSESGAAIQFGSNHNAAAVSQDGDITANNITATGAISAQSMALSTALGVGYGGTGSTNEAGARNNLGLGSIATQNADSISITGGSVTGLSSLSGTVGTLSGGTISSSAISGGSINGAAIGASSPATGSFTSLSANGASSLSGGGTLAGTFNAGSAALSGATLEGGALSGSIAASSATIAGGTLTGPAISGASLSGTIAASGATLSGAAIQGGAINGTAIGTTLPAAGVFTTVTAASFNGDVNGTVSNATNASSVPAAGVTGVLTLAQGGTGASTGAGARANLGVDNASNLTSGTLSVARLPLSGVVGGTYSSVTVDQYGRVTAGALAVNNSLDVGDSGVTVTDGGTDGTIKLTTDGSTRMVITSNGNVGIGTISPSRRLSVVDAGSDEQVYLGGPSGGAAMFGVDANNILQFKNGSASVKVAFDLTNGRIGIGTASPAQALSVVGNGVFSGSVTAPSGFIGNASTASALQTARSFSVTGDAATASAVTFDGTGNVALATTVGKLQGRTVATTAPTDGQVLLWDNTNSQWKPSGISADQISGGTIHDSNLQLPNGTAGAPALSFTNNTDMGLFRAGANTLGIATAGAERMQIDGSGRVGLGITPSVQFDVAGTPVSSGSNRVLAYLTDTSSVAANVGGGLAFGGVYKVDGSRTDWAGIMGGKENATVNDTAGYLALSTRPNGGSVTERMRITSTGNMGLGITPDSAAKLHLHTPDGTSSNLYVTTDTAVGTNAATLWFGSDKSGTPNWAGLGQYADGSLRLTGGSDLSNPHMTITDTGFVGIGTTAPTEKLSVSGNTTISGSTTSTGGFYGDVVGNIFLADGTAALPGLRFQNDTNTGLYRPGNDVLGFATGGTEKMRINASGYVGIGTASPRDALDVVGNVLATGSFSGVDATLSGTVYGSDGAAATPAYSFTSATSTGIFLGGINALSVATNGSERLRVTATGDLGLGTTSPASRLHIVGTDGALTIGDGTSTTLLGTVTTNGNLSNTSTAGDSVLKANSGNLILAARNSSGGVIFTTGTTDSEKARLTATGKLGLGTTTPTEALDVVGDANVSGQYRIGDNVVLNVNTTSNLAVGKTGGIAATGANNTTAGYLAGNSLTSGARNTALGTSALTLNATGNDNVALGYNAGANLTGGARNILIGSGAAANTATTNDQMNIGNALYGDLAAKTFGIGTSTPNYSLQLEGAAGAPALQLTNTATGSTTADGLTLIVNTDGTAALTQNENNSLQLGTNGISRLHILGNGDIGMGTDSPTERLHVIGNAIVTGTISATAVNAPVSGPISLPNGSAAAPALSFSNDPDTGLFRAGNKTIGFATNGTQKMLLDGNGILALGTASPNLGSVLHVAGTSSIIVPAGTTAERPTATQVVGMIRMNTETHLLESFNGTSWTTAGATGMDDGTNAASPGWAFTNESNTGFYRQTTGVLGVAAGGVDVARFNTATNAVNYLSFTPAATGAGPSVAAAGSDTNVDLNLAAKGTGAVRFFSNGAEKARITSDGKLGIGTTTPTEALDVVGNITASGTINGVAFTSTGGFQLGDGTVAEPSLAFTAATGTGFFRPATGTALGLAVGGTNALRLNAVASAVNYLSATNAATGNGPTLTATGTDTNVDFNLASTGTGSVLLKTGGGTQFGVTNTATAVNHLSVTGAATTGTPTLAAVGADTDVGLNVATQGNGAINLATAGTGAINLSTGGGKQLAVLNTATADRNLTITGGVSGSSTNPTIGTSGGNLALSSATGVVSVAGTAGFVVPVGTTAEQPANGVRTAGMLRFNSQTTQLENFNGTAWTNVGATGMADGTATAPGWAFNNDTNTGIFAPTSGGDILAIATNGTERLRVLADGKVGIGTTTPTEVLEVVGNIKASGTVSGTSMNLSNGLSLADGAAATPSLAFSDDLDTGFFSTAGNSGVIGFATNGVERMRVDSSGNVGIGATSLLSLLTLRKDQDTLTYSDVMNASSGNSAGAIIRLITSDIANSGTTSADIVKYRTGLLNIVNGETGAGAATAFSVAGTERFRIANNGTITLGAAAGAESLQVSPVASAVNKVTIAGGATGNGVSISAGGSDTNVPISIISKGTQNIGFATNGGTNQVLVTNTTGADRYITLTGSNGGNPIIDVSGGSLQIGSATGAPVLFGGGDNNSYIQNTAAGSIILRTTNGIAQFEVANRASAVNYLSVKGAATGNAPTLSAVGSDSNVSMVLLGKGTGVVSFNTGGTSGSIQAQVVHTASADQYLTLTGGVSGSSTSPTISTNSGSINLAPVSGFVGIGVANPTKPLQFASGASVSSGGVFTDASDRRLKDEILPLRYGLNDVLKLQPVSYTMRRDGSHQVGFIAQEVRDVIPELVFGTEGDVEKGETLSMSYGQMTAVLVSAVKDLNAKNEELAARNQDLSAKLDQLMIDQKAANSNDQTRTLLMVLIGLFAAGFIGLGAAVLRLQRRAVMR